MIVTFRILYVDDEPDLLDLGKIFLERDGKFTVDTIESAPAALSLLHSSHYDAIISDYQMPDMDGVEFLKKVRSQGNTIPFILFTGRGREEIVIQSINEGADFYLQKGGDPTPQFTELAHKVCQAIEKRRSEKLLLESQAQLRLIIDSIPVGIVTIDQHTHRILSANQKAIEMIGSDLETIEGHECHDFICPAEIGKCPVTDLGQRIDLSERVLLTQNKGRIPIIKSVVHTKIEGKEVLIESFFDISPSKQAEMTFQTLIKSMVGKTGLESLNEITTNVCTWLGTDIAMIMEITPDKKYGRILSMQPSSGKPPAGLNPIQGTPCGIAAEKGFYVCPDNLSHLFPDVKMPFDFVARSYAGLALRNYDGNVIGALCTFSQNPLVPPQKLQEIFEIIGVKAGAEIERKQTVEMLRLSEERFRVLLKNVPGVAIQGYRMDGTTFFWDEGSEKTYGYSAQEAIGKNLLELIIPDEMQDDVKGAIAYMAESGQPIPASEMSLMKKDRSRVPVFSSHVIVKKPQGELELYCLDMDLSERKETEDTIQKSAREWQATFDAISDMIYLIDDNGRIIRHNRAFETFIGKSSDKIDGRFCYEVLHGISAFVCECPNSRCRISRMREYLELSLDQRWFMIIVDPIIDASGEIAGAVHLISDITKRKETEEILRQSEEKFRSIVETSPDMIWEIGMDGKFQYLSPIVEEISGYKPEELLGKSILDLVPDDKKDAAWQKLERMVFKDGSLSPVEVTARHRDGRDLILEIRPARMTGTDQHRKGLRGIAIDITERRKVEDALKRANRQLNLLSDITRHDILNKISIILGFLEVARMKSGDPGQAEYLQKITTATMAIQSQIEFTRVYQDIGTHEPQWIDLDTVMPRPFVPATITLDADVKGYQVLADPVLEKVFFNLLDNTVRHGERVSRVTVSATVLGDDLVVVWEDNGIGIAANDKERIFERGFGKNTGLGMFLAREILSLTGITITENGEPGTRARFEIRVPKGKFQISKK